MVQVKDGITCLFWEDLWLNKVPEQNFLELFSFAKTKGISIKSAMDAVGPEYLFHLLIFAIALQQLNTLAADLNSLQETDEHDPWTYIWGTPFFHQPKHMSISQDIESFMLLSTGYGNQLAKINTRFSFGCF